MSSTFFLFGTMMFPEVLEIILARKIGVEELQSARLKGYCRYTQPHEVYPVLRRTTDAMTEGKLIQNVRAEDVRRMDWFETDFSREVLPVHHSGKTIDACVYIDHRTEPLFEHWDPHVFEQDHLHNYLDNVHRWMQLLPTT